MQTAMYVISSIVFEQAKVKLWMKEARGIGYLRTGAGLATYISLHTNVIKFALDNDVTLKKSVQ